MKVLFSHDGPIRKDEYNNFYGSAHNDEMFKRYFTIAEEIIVAMRFIDISSNQAEENFSKITLNNLQFCEIPNLNSINYIRHAKKAQQIMDSIVYDVDYVIARLPSTIGNLAIKSAKKYGKPYLVEVVGCSWDAYKNHGSILGKIIAPLAFIKQRYYIKNSPYTIYITKEFLQKRYPTNGENEIIPNVLISPVPKDIFDKRIEKIHKQSNSLKIGLVGSLNVQYKGHKTLLRALNLIKKEIPEFKIEFLGAGDKANWTQLVTELDLVKNTSFIGTLESGKAVFEWMDTVDIAIQPSLAEAQGRSIIEFMSRGCPVIATTVGGIVELLDNSFLVAPNDYINLSKKILKMLEKNEMLNQAKNNFFNSQEYYNTVIEKRRKQFFLKFKNNIR